MQRMFLLFNSICIMSASLYAASLSQQMFAPVSEHTFLKDAHTIFHINRCLFSPVDNDFVRAKKIVQEKKQKHAMGEQDPFLTYSLYYGDGIFSDARLYDYALESVIDDRREKMKKQVRWVLDNTMDSLMAIADIAPDVREFFIKFKRWVSSDKKRQQMVQDCLDGDFSHWHADFEEFQNQLKQKGYHENLDYVLGMMLNEGYFPTSKSYPRVFKTF